MHINNPDALKSWLTTILEPLCDADPSALSRYVLALLKKDKPVKDLSQCMAEQLDVFLGPDTQPFLDRLFVVIKSEEYIKGDELTPSTIINTTTTTTTIDETENENRECTPPIGDNKPKENPVKLDEISSNSVQTIGQQTTATPAVISPTSKSHEPSPTKILAEKDNNLREIRRRRISLRSRSRSRSRSYDRERRSRSRERRINDREKTSRQFRNKSPPPQIRRYERRIDRSPRSYGRTRHHSGSRSRSGSQERHKVSPTNDDLPTTTTTKRLRCRDFDEKGYCMRGETCPWDHGVDPVVLEDINNPALISIQSSSGPHSRGEYSPDNPDLWNRGGNFMGPRGGGPPHRTGGGVGGSVGISYPRGLTPNFRGCPPFQFAVNPSATTPLQRELIPVPVVDGNNTSSGGGIGSGISNNNSNTAGGEASIQTKRRFEPEDTVAIGEGGIGPIRRKIPINNRLGPRINTQQNCSLELRKVPRGLNSISHLNNHFTKFGKIINIQISYDGDPEAAIITFSTHAEANVAYRSTEAVLNNRFIKVFWHSINNINDQQSSTTIQSSLTNNNSNTNINNKDDLIQSRRLYQTQHTINNIPAIPVATTTETINEFGGKNSNSINSSTSSITTSTATPTTTTSSISTTTPVLNNTTNLYTTTNNITTGTTSLVNTNSISQSAAVQLRLKNNRINRATAELIRKKQDEHVKTAVQLAHGLHKRKHDLLQEYIKQMRSALELVERAENTDPQRSKLLTTIKDLQLSIDKLRKEISIEQAQMAAQIQNQQPIKKSKEQQQKELLDVELELITQQQEGNDTTAIQKRLFELQRTYGSSVGSGGGTTRSHFPRSVRVRPAPPGSTSVDRRPTIIQIVGFNLDESDALLGHFKHFGEITKNVLDKTVPSLTISYATRSNAEQAMLRGRVFKEKRIQITWAIPTISIPLKPDVIIAADPIHNNASVSTELRLDDEEEEEEEEEEDAESEDRTWRR